MENQLWQDIQAQSGNLRSVVEHLYGQERSNIQAAATFLRNDRPIALVGIGSAEYLCMPAETYLGQQGRFASTISASEAFYNLLPALKWANIVINSRSGETIEVVKLCQALKAENTPFVLITNEPESTAARLATHIIWTNTRKDLLVSINVVTAMMTATLVTAAAAVGKMDAVRPQLDHLLDQFASIVERASLRAQEIADFFDSIRPIYLLSRGCTSGAAFCGRLVLEEVARYPSVALDAAEFRQGPNEVVDERFGCILFLLSGFQGQLSQSLSQDIQKSGGKVLTVGHCAAASGPQELQFPIVGIDDFLLPVASVVPVQVLAYKLAEKQGYQPGDVRYISKVITSEQGIPNQR